MARSEQFIMDEDGTLPKDKVRIRERWGGFFQTRLNKKSPKLDPTISALFPQRPLTPSLGDEQCGIRPARSTIDMLFVVCRLQELERASKIPLYMCFIDLQKAYDSVDRELLWILSLHASVYQKICLPLSASSTKACELACVRIMVSTRTGLTSFRCCGKDVCCRRFFSISSLL